MLNDIYDLTGQDPKSLQERALKLAEEAGEVAQAVLCATGAPGTAYKGLTLSDVREEAVDAVIVALAILAQVSESKEAFETDLERLLDLKCGKWRATLNRTD